VNWDLSSGQGTVLAFDNDKDVLCAGVTNDGGVVACTLDGALRVGSMTEAAMTAYAASRCVLRGCLLRVPDCSGSAHRSGTCCLHRPSRLCSARYLHSHSFFVRPTRPSPNHAAQDGATLLTVTKSALVLLRGGVAVGSVPAPAGTELVSVAVAPAGDEIAVGAAVRCPASTSFEEVRYGR
jgi:hypothetical protein